MIGRRQLAVASPISGWALVRAFAHSIQGRDELSVAARELVANKIGSRSALLTDSGTSALVLALRLAVGKGGTVGLPGYGCVDLVAAALYAGARVRVYDIDPVTLSPDLDSVQRLLRRGVDAIVVAHLFGYPANVPGVRELASAEGVIVIEDAAQGAGGSLGGTRLGGLGELSVVSFGRGKELCAGGGGALLASGERRPSLENALALPAPGSGWSGLSSTAVQWVLGRPSLYALPSALPWLHLGEMVYHPASEPRAISVASSSLIASAFALEEVDLAGRRSRAHVLDESANGATQLGLTTALPSAQPGYLRYAIRDVGGRRRGQRALGVVRPYPGTLLDYPEVHSVLAPGEPTVPGASETASLLYTLPTHRFVGRSDLTALGQWLRSPAI